MPLTSGTFLGPYELIGLIGSGGMGEVYRARDPRLRRDVALKILKAGDGDAVARFKSEARSVAAITHPNIMAVHDYGEQDGTAWIVYELLEGESLRERISRGPLPWRNAVEIAADIATGLAAAHAKGIVHGDVKPENVFVTADGRVTLVDFGLARLARAHDVTHDATAPVDAATSVMGTFAYMAPESLSGEIPTAASDLFALGCVLYEMITGQQAFSASTAISTITMILNTEPIPMAGRATEVPDDIEAIVDRCLSKQPANRFGSARDLGLMLRSLVSPTSRSRLIPIAARPRGLRPSMAALAALAIGAAAVVGWMLTRSASATMAIAVLPFENATADPNADYIADGVTENLINALSQIPALSVRARSSVFRLKGKNVAPEKAARDLNAEVIMTGRIRRRGESFVVSAELTKPSEKRQLWGKVYDVHAERLLAVQEEIAREVIAALEVSVSTPVRERISARMPSNSVSYELHLRGRFHLNKRTEESFMQALTFFARAIEHDPTFALGYSGLADCYVLLNGYGLRKPAEVMPKAIAAITRALQLDPGLAEAHATMAAIHANHDFDWKSAEDEYRKAIALNPSYATARQWYGGFLTAAGRFDDAMIQLESARQLDPLSLIVPVQIGLRHYFARRYDDAIREYQNVFELSPDFSTAHEYTSLAYEAKGMHAEAVSADLRARRARGEKAEDLAAAQGAFDKGGMIGYKRWLLERALTSRKTEYLSPVESAMLYAQTGDRDNALKELQAAVEHRASGLIWIRLEPRFDPLRDDPRFQKIVADLWSGGL